MKLNKREIGYDIVRVVAMLFVILLHTNPKPYQNGSLWQELFLSVFFACNGLFFMLSGRFTLTVKLDGAKSILRFYKQKFFTLLLPLIVFGTLSFWVDLYKSGESYTLGSFLEGALRGLLGEFNDGYLWFMFALIGLTLGAPFLGRMVQNMKRGELHVLAAVGLVWEIFSVYIGKNAGLGFGYNSWFLLGYSYYYFLGYYVYRIFDPQAVRTEAACEARLQNATGADEKMVLSSETRDDKKVPLTSEPCDTEKPRFKTSTAKKILIIAGFAAFVLNALWTWKMPLHSYNAHDLAPLYTVFVVGLYLLLSSIRLRPDSKIARAISWIAGQSYFVYLLHRILLRLWINDTVWFSGKMANYLSHFVICAVCSILVAFLLNLVYKPLLRKVK